MSSHSFGLSTPGSRVVLIGAGTPGPESNLPPVPAVEVTVEHLGDALVEHCGLDRANLRTILAPQTAADIGRPLGTFAREATGVLLVYFVGHGVVAQSGQFYLATGRTNNWPSSTTSTPAASASHVAWTPSSTASARRPAPCNRAVRAVVP